MKYLAALACCLLLLANPARAQSDVLDNATIVMLVDAKIGDEVIIAKIQTSPNRFDLSVDALIELKKKGVSSAVLAAMVSASKPGPVSAAAAMSADSPDPMVPHPSGVYLLQETLDPSRMERLNPVTANQTKTGGFLGYALTSGIASMSMKSVIPGGSARITTADTTPVFYFYFDEANPSLSGGAQTSAWLLGPASPVTSPNEFSLVRLTVKKDRREVRVGSFNIAGAKSGVMDKDRIAFTYDQVAPGVFRVTPSEPLPPGQYGFIYSVTAGGAGPGIGGAGAMTARMFDFGISGPPAPAKRKR
jgi:hypothetical protein